jgi:hypothetical protein
MLIYRMVMTTILLPYKKVALLTKKFKKFFLRHRKQRRQFEIPY